MTHINPVTAWCPINETGVLLVQHIQFRPADITIPPGTGWRIVRIVVDTHEAWSERDEAWQAIDALPDAVACATLAAQRDEWVEEEVS